MNKTEVNKKITDFFIKKLKEGDIPWKRGFSLVESFSINTRKAYRGINQVLTREQGFASPYWLTFNKAKQLGGAVKKGQSGTPIFQPIVEKERNPITEKLEDVCKGYTVTYVFNIEQCKDLNLKDIDLPEVRPVIQEAEDIWLSYPDKKPSLTNYKNPCYMPKSDFIGMPSEPNFKSKDIYYASLFHEMVHSTGHKDRLNREGIANVSFERDETYSYEELIAETGSAILTAHTGLSTPAIMENKAAYINGWIKILGSNPRFIIDASLEAQKAVDFILNKEVA
jgi:antirestriction protein ArdC